MKMPITQEAIQTANKFAAQQPNPQKAEQVYLNTLAVWAVNDYLQLMEIETDLAKSDSWNPVVRLCADIADLNLKGLGTLECRPAIPSCPDPNQEIEINSSLSELTPCAAKPICQIAPEVWCDRIGYVVVEIDQKQKSATLLGFAKTPETGELYLHQLQSIDDLLEYLEYLAQPKVNLNQWFANVFVGEWQEPESVLASNLANLTDAKKGRSKLKMGNWFQHIVDAGLQEIKNLLGTENNQELQLREATAFRRGGSSRQLFPEPDIMRAKLIDLGMELGTKKIALIMALTQEKDGKINILVQVHPGGSDRYLPTDIKLVLLSEFGKTLQEVQSRGMDLWMQLRQFRVAPGTNFSLEVAIDDISITEAFTL